MNAFTESNYVPDGSSSQTQVELREVNNDESESNEGKFLDAPKDLWGARHNFALLGFLGLASVYMMRVNLSVAIVDMVKVNTSSLQAMESYFNAGPTENGTDQCAAEGSNMEENNNGEFDWSSTDQGLILGAFFWGYFVTQIPGGILAERFGGKIVFGMGVLLTDLFCLITPVAARSSKELLIAVRVLTGLAEGVTFPAVNSMISKWVPNSERTTIGSFVLAGTQIGTVISLPLSGVLCSIELDNGWPFAFYVPGALGVIWLFAWYFLVFDNPDSHPRITKDEKSYILSSTNFTTQKSLCSNTPWVAIFTSVHLWAILFAHYGFSWGYSMFLTELPTYMKTVLHFDLKANGLLSALPYLSMWIASIVFSFIANMLRNRKILSMTGIRKVFTTIGLLLPAFGLIGASFTGCDKWATLALITVSTGFTGAIYSGVLANHIDLASNYAGTMMGITNCVAQTSGFLAPFVVGLFVTDSGSVAQWQHVFFLSAGIYAATNLFYVIFATAEEQSWNTLDQNRKNDIEIVQSECNETN